MFNFMVVLTTASEAGKGFAVVAQELRNLVSRSANVANTIKNLVEEASNKLIVGKNISDDIILGYISLNEKD